MKPPSGVLFNLDQFNLALEIQFKEEVVFVKFQSTILLMTDCRSLEVR
jgi:hypothetical protein